MSDEAAIEVVDVPERHRFEIRVDGVRAGHAEYSRKGDRLIFTHTEIDDAYEGQGLGSKLASGALDAARATDHPVVPLCPFIASYVEKHPEYDDLVDHECLAYLEQKRERPRAS
jgi:predicted GNAT family acetyltransferase